MKILLFDTCGAEGSVALADTRKQPPLVALVPLAGRTASERLVAVVRETLKEKSWTINELDLLVVVAGPGSFTGVRVGLSAAKGLSEAIRKPVIAVSRLALLAAEARPSGGEVLAMLDAGRDELYCGRYLGANCIEESLAGLTEAAILASQATAAVTCDASVVGIFRAVMSEIEPLLLPSPTAADALPIALRRFHEGSFDDPAKLDANYLRRTDAQIFAKPLARHVTSALVPQDEI